MTDKNTDQKATACQKTPDTASARLRFAQLERRELNDVRQQRDIATAQLALCKLHADKLAAALDDITLWLSRSVEMAADCRKVLVAYIDEIEVHHV